MSEKINSEQFFNDIGFDDYLPTFKAKIYNVTVETQVAINATWTQEMADDLNIQHGIDVNEMLVNELAREVDRNILNRIMNLDINENRQG